MSSELIESYLLGFVDGKRLVQKTSKDISAILWYVASIRSASRSALGNGFSAPK